ncbi:hypothetical protein AB2L27_08285 [Kineococcus sp. LSe6-4]|uniref:Uncharacterized protein n=1 Tax=Kineococcus halophytocola TaxID=3234027 RepID=A0ABV4GZM6_9ACTN
MPPTTAGPLPGDHQPLQTSQTAAGVTDPFPHPADLVSQHLLPGVGFLFAVYLTALLALVLLTAAVKVHLRTRPAVRPGAHAAGTGHGRLHRASRRGSVVLPPQEPTTPVTTPVTAPATATGGAS